MKRYKLIIKEIQDAQQNLDNVYSKWDVVPDEKETGVYFKDVEEIILYTKKCEEYFNNNRFFELDTNDYVTESKIQKIITKFNWLLEEM